MIPLYPIFKPLALEDRVEIFSLVREFPPYSDYNFTSLWSWNTEEQASVSRLDDHLILRFSDYVTGKPLYSVLGKGSIRNTILKIFEQCRKEGVPEEVRLIPEAVIQHSSDDLEGEFCVTEDHNNHDYVLSVKDIALMNGSGLHKHRNLVRRFIQEHPVAELRELPISETSTKEGVLALFDEWAVFKKLSPSECQNERQALMRHLTYAAMFPEKIHFMGLYEKGRLIGFNSDEILHDHFAVSHFQKALPEHRGVYQYLWHEAAKKLHKHGVLHLNIEQDLGLPGLRKAKKLWNPSLYLKKFTIQPKMLLAGTT